MTDLGGRIIVLTGAAGGMGSVMALALAEAGAVVAAIDRDEHALAALLEHAHMLGCGRNIKRYTADLENRGECEAVIPRITADLHGLYGLINLAGVGHTVFSPDCGIKPLRFWECDVSGWETLMAINVRAPWILAGAAVWRMRQQGFGRIVNITTSFDTMLQPNNAAYGQSKAALEAATASWARELEGSGITVNALAPGGPTNTGLIPANSPMPRDKMIQPEVMAGPIVWLMSDEADDFTNRRVIASHWDQDRPKDAPKAAWPGFGVQAIRP